MTTTRAELVMRWAMTVATFAARLAQLPQSLLPYAPPGDPWRVGDIVYHTAKGLTYPRDMHALASVGRQLTTEDFAAYEPTEHSRALSVGELRALTQSASVETMLFLACADDATFWEQRAVTFPSGNHYPFTMADLLTSSIDHMNEHMDQLDRWVKSAIAAR